VASALAVSSTLIVLGETSGAETALRVQPWCDLVVVTSTKTEETQAVKALQTQVFGFSADPLLTRDSAQTTRNADLQVF
jgi:hypothetical protein